MPQLAPFLQDHLAEEIADLVRRAPLPSLGAGPQNRELQQWLASPQSQRPTLPLIAQSALWLLAGDLDASHHISQSIADADGSFLHAVMHRREGDYSNAKYWFRRVGAHPVLAELARTGYGDPISFVDRCAAAIGSGREDETQCEQWQWLEWQLLFAHCTA